MFGDITLSLSSNKSLICTVLSSGRLKANCSFEEILCEVDDFRNYTNGSIIGNEKDILYSVYRHLYENSTIRKANIKFDITILPNTTVCNELPRTRGHYHLPVKGHSKPYFDIYQICEGNAVVQLHGLPGSDNTVYLVLASRGDILPLPPDLCHVVYNAGEGPLIFSNWCTNEEHLDYDSMKATNGPSVYIYGHQNSEITGKVNSDYCEDPAIKILKMMPNDFISGKFRQTSNQIYDWHEDRQLTDLFNNPSGVGDWINEFYVEEDQISFKPL